MSLPHSEAEGFVLAGGKSTRMGQDKALLRFCGAPLIQHALEILSSAGVSSCIAGARSDLSHFASVVPDLVEESGLGPVAGICAALSVCASRFAVFLPVDLPLIPASLIGYLVHHATISGAAVTVVSCGGFVQTFPAVVDRATAGSLMKSLHSGDRNCLKAFRAAGRALLGGVCVLPLELLVQPGHVSHPVGLQAREWFLNLNAPDDLASLGRVMTGLDRG